MTNGVKKVPELRFPDFDEEWEGIFLNKLGMFKKNYTFSRANEGEGTLRHIHYGDIHSKFKSKIEKIELLPSISVDLEDPQLVQNNDLIFADASEDYNDLGKTILMKVNNGNVIAGLHTHLFSPNNSLNSEFLLYFTQTKVYRKFIKRQGVGISVLGISKKNLDKLLVSLPKYNEQKKIGEFFSKLDRQIELEEQKLEKLEEQKKGYMQNIFAQKLYFKDENGNKYPDWTIKKLNEVFEVSKQRNTNNEYSHKDVLSVSREHGVINQIKYHGRSYAAKTVENYKIVKPHDLIYTKSPLKGAPYGIFKVTTEEGIISPLYAVYTSLNENITDFVSYYFEFNNITTHYLSKLVSKGAKNTINVTDEMALTGKILLPNSEKEVTQIVNFFNEIRELIMKQRNKIEGLKMRKQGFLQKMFV